ncbi:MAG: hypothetical protein P8I94_07465, partial [Emcibacteraceae bacterium]|nr:hypothetical protein [Emcibacteraceae bacterium]
MKSISFIILFTITSINVALAQITEDTIQDALETTKWSMNCNEESCLFQRDIYHNSGEELAMITVFVSIDNATKDVSRMAIFYPASAAAETGGFFAFIPRDTNQDEKKENQPIRLPFAACIEDGCIVEVIPNENKAIENSIKDNLLNN